MAVKMEKTIKVEELSLSRIAEIIKQGAGAPIEDQIAATVLLNRMINGYVDKAGNTHPGFKNYVDELEDRIEHTSFDTIKEALVAAGKISSTDVTPVIQIGETVKVKLSSKTVDNFKIDTARLKAISDAVPDKFKKTTVSIDKAAFEAAYNAGTLDDILKPYCSKSPETVTKMTQTKLK